MKHPYSGAIVGEVVVGDADQRPIGAVKLVLLGRTYSCSVVADPVVAALALSGEDAGDYNARLVSGAGGLGKPVKPMEWAQGAVVSQVLTYILQAGGETMATDINQAVLGQALVQWSVTAGDVLGALSALVEFLAAGIPGLVWRIRSDGMVWLGVPVPAAAAPPDYIVVAPGPEAGQAVWDLNDTSVDVDQIIDGLTLRQVIYSWEPNQLRATVTFAPGPVNVLYQLFQQWQRRIGVDYFKSVPGRIAAQNDSASCQFQPDNSRYTGMRKTALRYGLPDTECTGVTGRAAAGWDGSSPAAPVLQRFEPGPGCKAVKIKIGRSSPVGTRPLVNKDQRDAEADLNDDIQSAYTIIGNTPEAVTLPSALALLNVIQQALGGAAGLGRSYADYEAKAAGFLTTILEGG